ncbi:MAG: TauD/TfdA family dioxygenase [Acetobacteraceae bacterium]|nr:TauD/TfdA family dioxygenase [Acetobacteraceae bacterium]
MIHDDPRIEVSRRWVVSDVFDRGLPPHLAWQHDNVSEPDWKLPIPSECLAEIDAAVQTLRAHPVPTLVLTPAEFAMPACRHLMGRVKAVLDDGVGFVVLDRLPVDRYDKAELTTIYWLLSQMIARPVAQAFQGTLLYDVHDTGQKTSTRVRADLTNEDLSWHTDYGFNHPPPYIGLLVLRTARSGGESSTASLLAGHETLRQRAPALLRRLYQPYVWNRQGEHPDGDPICSSNPVFSATTGTVRSRFNRSLQPVGYRLVDQEIDAAGMAALNALHEVMSEPGKAIDFVLAPGQIQFLNNTRVAHRRTAYEDYDEPDRRRHLVRIFLRDEGRRSYMG